MKSYLQEPEAQRLPDATEATINRSHYYRQFLHGYYQFDCVVTKEVTRSTKFYIPEGFAHGFLVLSDEAEFAYKCTDFYHPGDEGGLLWSDPEIGVDWPIEPGMELIISDKDKKWSGLKDTFKF